MDNNFIKSVRRFQQRYYPCDRMLLKRLIKCCVHSTLCYICCLFPPLRDHLGLEPSFLPLISVIIHPGRRLSATIQHTVKCGFGLLSGLCWALLGREIAQRCLGHTWNILSEAEHRELHYTRYQAALAILVVFECIMLFYHGWMRSVEHTNFAMVFPFFLVVHFAFSEPLIYNAREIALSYTAPFFLGIAMALVWNVILFPDLGTTYLGTSVINSLNNIHAAVDDSVKFFTSANQFSKNSSLYLDNYKTLLKYKNSVQSKISVTNLVYNECAFEISYSYMAPHSVKSVIDQFRNLSLCVNGLINACQLEFFAIDNDNSKDFIQTKREVIFVNQERLLKILSILEPCVNDLGSKLSHALYQAKIALAYSYDVCQNDVKTSNIFPFTGNVVIGKDQHANHFHELTESIELALKVFDKTFKNELAGLGYDMLTPSDEMFLLSSFLMNFKQCARTIISVVKETDAIYTKRVERESKGWIRGKKLWFNFMGSFKQFIKFVLGGSPHRGGKTPTSRATHSVTESQALQGNVGNNVTLEFEGSRGGPSEGIAQRPKYEEEQLLGQSEDIRAENMESLKRKETLPVSSKNSSKINTDETLTLKEKLLHAIAFLSIQCKTSWRPHFIFGFQVTVCLIIVSVPMFLPEGRAWYGHMHGPWMAFVAILCMEPNVGGTFWVSFLRSFGVVAGSAWAYLCYVAGYHNSNDPYLCTVLTVFGAFPGFYYFIATPYVKGAIIYIITIYIVLLATIIPSKTLKSGILQNFAKRCFAVATGAPVALVTQLVFFPIQARDCLNEELSFVCGCLSQMILLLETGLENDSSSSMNFTSEKYHRFATLSSAAKAALKRANEYKGLTRQEPRIKGEYINIEQAQTDIIQLMKEIVERLDNIGNVTIHFGSDMLKDVNKDLHAYRRQGVASLLSVIRALGESYLNKTPLPPFLPSARICHRRFVNRIKEVMDQNYGHVIQKMGLVETPNDSDSDNESDSKEDSNDGMLMFARKKKLVISDNTRSKEVLRDTLLSWNARNANFEEVIEYVEELVVFTKKLVGSTDFQYGFLSRPLNADWAAQAVTDFDDYAQNGRSPSKLQPSSSHSSKNESFNDDGVDDSVLIRMPTIQKATTLDMRTKKRAYSIGSIDTQTEEALAHIHDPIPSALNTTDDKQTMPTPQETSIKAAELPAILKNVFVNKRND
ncbi:hypothetical protein ACO0QE_002220 [Hanseniaspora vineae]